MFQSFGFYISRNAILIIVIWIVALVLIRTLTPRWDDVTHDGDLAYLPHHMPSVVGERKLIEAFPHEKSKSQAIIVIAKENSQLIGSNDANSEEPVASDLARVFFNELGVHHLVEARKLSEELAEQLISKPPSTEHHAQIKSKILHHQQRSEQAFKNAINHDESLAEHYILRKAEKLPGGDNPPTRLAEAYFNMALLLQDRNDSNAKNYYQQAARFNPKLSEAKKEPIRTLDQKIPLLNVWTWEHRIFGPDLGKDHPHARLIFLQLGTELMAVENMKVMQTIEQEIAKVQSRVNKERPAGLLIATSGTAAVGSDMLSSAAQCIKNTEIWTIILVTVILLVVYRSPLLVAVPLITIGCSVVAATGIIAALTQLNLIAGFEWWDFKIFKTTKIFLVVILFGAGTDYCLFLIARYKEELDAGFDRAIAIDRALTGVGSALAASALTTILGLGMMFFSDFGKYRNSGPALALAIVIGLLACVTLAPALLRILGGAVFWPFGVGPKTNPIAASNLDHSLQIKKTQLSLATRFWQWMASLIIAHPGLILMISAIFLFPIAWLGTDVQVTYDFLSELDPSRPSKQGTALLRKHFAVGESGPIVILAHKSGHWFDIPIPEKETPAQKNNRNSQLRDNAKEITQLANRFRTIEGIVLVKTLIEPDGRPAKGRSKDWLKQLVLRTHPMTKEYYVTDIPKFEKSITKFVLIPKTDPFSFETTATLRRVKKQLDKINKEEGTFWHGVEFTYSGPTAAIADLREVTQSDNVRIKLLVTITVFLILLIILRRPLICLYLILSVLLSYYVTIGITEWFFGVAYGESFQGLDWKVPIFLFVILVAIGEDYNIYLTTRVFEEQKEYGKVRGIRRGVVSTGGIITSCGVIMAGTFISMTSGSWASLLPQWLSFLKVILPSESANLRAITELGFALSLGVMLDTLVVRPILVPAFLMFCSERNKNKKEDQAAGIE